MPNRLDRLDLLVRILRDRPGITARDLAERLDVSVRSVFRDLAAVRERGYPVESSPGRGGGLGLSPKWGLGRVLLPVEEALAALLSLAVAEQLGLPLFTAGLGPARAKLVDAFPPEQRKRMAPLRERILVGPPASAAVRSSYGTPRRRPMQELQSAFLHGHLVTCVYRSEGDKRTERGVEPHALLLNWPAWYLLAFDHLRGEARTFRLDRFESAREEDASFVPHPHRIIRSIRGLNAEDHLTWRV